MTAVIRRTRVKQASGLGITSVPVSELIPDETNPRQSSAARAGLLRLSLAKLGFLTPVFVQKSTGLLLSGHQRLTQAKDLGIENIPAMAVDLTDEDVKGINVLFNRITNDFTAFDTGAKAEDRIDIATVAAAAEALPDHDGASHAALQARLEPIAPLLRGHSSHYDKKAALAAHTLLRKGIRIPAVVAESGRIVNGIHRLFSAVESGEQSWPVVRIPDEHADVASQFLNYLSMDFKIDGEFKDLLRAGAFRRKSNDKGLVPKAARFWSNGCKTLLDKDSYTPQAWANFREVHGNKILDFGAGLGRMAPYLRTKGFEALDFEPYRIDPESDTATPSPMYSRSQARKFLEAISDPDCRFDSIFLCSVMNSIPFPEDRLKVLAIVHALCDRETVVYGTCRDISDYNYEYGGERRSTYFVMDTEPGIRLGDVTSRPKLQKFHSQAEATAMFSRFWKDVQLWPGGNVFYYRLSAPMGVNVKALSQSLEYEFGSLPFLDGSTMNLLKEARRAFIQRLKLKGMP